MLFRSDSQPKRHGSTPFRNCRIRYTPVELLSTIERLAFFTWVREANSIWAYPAIRFLHTVGLAMVVGLSAMISLRILGFARALPVAPLERYVPVIWAGFWLNAVSGAILLAADATAKMTNPAFAVKMLLVALAAANLIRLRRVVFRDLNGNGSVSGLGKRLAAISLLLWFGAITAGRLMVIF